MNRKRYGNKINTIEELSSLSNVTIGILSICGKKKNINEKIIWFKKYCPFIDEETINIICKEQEVNKSSKELKSNF